MYAGMALLPDGSLWKTAASSVERCAFASLHFFDSVEIMTTADKNNPVVDRANRKTRYDPTESGAMDEIAKPLQPEPQTRQLSPEEKARAESVLNPTVNSRSDQS
jgi:hypothetical protein